MQNVLALLLAGGRVDELSVLTMRRPKSAMPFGGGYRIIDFALSNLINSGIEKVGVLSQYRSDSLINHLGSGAAWDMLGSDRRLVLLPPMHGDQRSDWYRGTADAVFQNMEIIRRQNPDLVLVLSGDHIYDMDYQELIDYHKRCNADITMSFVRPTGGGSQRFGQGVMDGSEPEGGRVTEYHEKPEQKQSDWASMTVYLFNMSTLEELAGSTGGRHWDHFGRDLFPEIVDNYNVFGFQHHGLWLYSQTIPEYYQANMQVLNDPASMDFERWGIRTNLASPDNRDRPPALIAKSASVSNSIVANGCVVEGRVENSILFPGVHVAAGSVVKDSILFNNVNIHQNATVKKVIADFDVTIGENARVGQDLKDDNPAEITQNQIDDITLIGFHCNLPANIEIGKNCIVCPDIAEFQTSTIPNGRVVR